MFLMASLVDYTFAGFVFHIVRGEFRSKGQTLDGQDLIVAKVCLAAVASGQDTAELIRARIAVRLDNGDIVCFHESNEVNGEPDFYMVNGVNGTPEEARAFFKSFVSFVTGMETMTDETIGTEGEVYSNEDDSPEDDCQG